MATIVRLVPMPTETSFAPLGVLGYCLSRTGFFKPLWGNLQMPLKTVEHRPEAKLLDVLVSILAGCRAIAQINTRCGLTWRSPMPGAGALCRAGHHCRTLDACGAEQVRQLRAGNETLFRGESFSLRHDLAADWLWLDLDLTPLPISKQAESSTKGKFGEKTAMAASWHGSMPRSITRRCFPRSIPATRRAARRTCRVQALQSFLAFTPEQCQRVILRTDAGFGSDANINHVLADRWQVVTKNKGGRRPQAFARQIAAEDWYNLGHERWVRRSEPHHLCASHPVTCAPLAGGTCPIEVCRGGVFQPGLATSGSDRLL